MIATFTKDRRIDLEKLFRLRLYNCGIVSGVEALDMVCKGRCDLGQKKGRGWLVVRPLTQVSGASAGREAAPQDSAPLGP